MVGRMLSWEKWNQLSCDLFFNLYFLVFVLIIIIVWKLDEEIKLNESSEREVVVGEK